MDPVTILLSIALILFLAYVYNNWNQHMYKNFPPGPTPLPIIGNIHIFDMENPNKTFIELSKKYGPVYSVQFGMAKMVVLSGYDTIKDALINHTEEFSDRPKAPVISKLVKDHGLVFANGENWKVMRRFTLSTLRDFGMGKKGIEDKITEEVENLLQAFRSYGGKPFDHLNIINAAVANIIVSILLGHRFEYDDPIIVQLMNIINENIRLLGSPLVKLYKKYGPVFSVQLGMTKMVILCGYDTIKDALINHAEEFSDRPKAPIISKLVKDNGLVFANGENWKVMRRFTLSTLRDFGMGKKGIENKITEEVENLLQTFRSYGGKPFDHLTIMNAAVANIIVSVLISHRYEYDDPTIVQLMNLINENLRLLGSPVVRLYSSFPTVMDWLPGLHKKVLENLGNMQSFVRATFTKQKKELDVNDQRNFIDAFLAKQIEGKPESTLYYHNDNLIALVGNLFAAGMETTTTTLRWGLLLMMKYPEIQKKVQKEIERVVGSAQPRMEHRKQMPYTDAVIHEIQRFGDIVPGNVPHATSQDVTFRGYFFPKGITVIPFLTSALKDADYFEKPDEFYPEHFLTSEGHFKKNEAFIPFSIGKRSCAGENMAKMELFLFFTSLLQNFTFQAPPGAQLDLTPIVGSTNAPKSYEICAIPRS
ncbi:cytochrome P450 2C5-like [Pseudophryne corroboree]|uniref:cytochrome P450 2C5-like n=1 Tax=Pseudophryne corroboree TaxID=495146 RepID=UPI003081FC2A